jgi:hypothetical protein
VGCWLVHTCNNTPANTLMCGGADCWFGGVVTAQVSLGLVSAAYDRTLEQHTLRAARVLLQDDAATPIAQAPPSLSPPPPDAKDDGAKWWMYVVVRALQGSADAAVVLAKLRARHQPEKFSP